MATLRSLYTQAVWGIVFSVLVLVAGDELAYVRLSQVGKQYIEVKSVNLMKATGVLKLMLVR